MEQNNKDRFMIPMKILKDAGAVEGMKIADLGCGAGYFTIVAAKIVGDKGKVYAVDCMESALESVETKVKIEGLEDIVETLRGDLEVYGGSKIPDNQTSIVILKTVLFQSQKHKEILSEAYRVLAKGGRLVFIEWEPTGMPMGPNEGNRVDKEYVLKLAQEIGFQQIGEVETDRYHYGVVFEK
ncbi:class I SAM-dependent methyltransferase [bacterium]|nr:MAG: class I SAM-dependent methyltransferase [bacterium]